MVTQMATQTDLFLAILALDAYNRGDKPRVTVVVHLTPPNPTMFLIGDFPPQAASARAWLV
jgi:hypothetical protein